VFRAILYLLLTVVVISVIRSVVGIIGKLFGEMVSPSSAPRTPGSAAAGSPTVETLHKDPVCGTFVAPSTAWQKAVGGKTYYFCSTDCREKFKG
jgi:uncharacterized protein